VIAAAFPKGSGNGHHFINKSDATTVYLEVGARSPTDFTVCSDIDMMSSNADAQFVHKDGAPYPDPSIGATAKDRSDSPTAQSGHSGFVRSFGRRLAYESLRGTNPRATSDGLWVFRFSTEPGDVRTGCG
jgi:hypothetical protein